MTCPALIFASIHDVRMNPTCRACIFCNRSMNGTSAGVAVRTFTGIVGTGRMGAVVIMESPHDQHEEKPLPLDYQRPHPMAGMPPLLEWFLWFGVLLGLFIVVAIISLAT